MKLLTALRYLLVHIRQDWLRSLLTVLSVAAIVCVYLMSSAMVNDMQRLGQSLLRFPESLLLVFSRNAVFPTDSHIERADLAFYADKIEASFGADAVAEAVPFLYRVVKIGEHSVIVAGANYTSLGNITRLDLVEGDWPSNFGQVLVNRDFAALTGIGVGGQVRIYGSDLAVVGVIDSGLWQNALILLDYEQAMHIYQLVDDFQIGGLQLAAWVDPIEAHQALQGVYNDELCCHVYLHDHYYALTQNAFKGFISLYGVVQAIGLLLITFGAYNAAALALAEHQREIIISRVIGFSGRQMAGLLLLRTYLVMSLAFLLGWLAAALITHVSFTLNPFSMSGVMIMLKFTAADVLAAFAWTSLCTVLGVIVSSLRYDPLKKGSQLRSLSKSRAV